MLKTPNRRYFKRTNILGNAVIKLQRVNLAIKNKYQSTYIDVIKPISVCPHVHFTLTNARWIFEMWKIYWEQSDPRYGLHGIS